MLAFTFPGQGSQRPGMGAAWADHPSWRVVAEASEATGRDLAALLLDADADELTRTRNAQLATFTLGLVVLDAARAAGLQPAACAGHSLGEYTALVAAGVLTPADGVQLVHERGEAMQAAAEARPGTMAAVLGAEADTVRNACEEAGDAWIANDNAPGQLVIAGTVEGVERAGRNAKDAGAKKVMGLPVGGAFHTPLMAPASERLSTALAGTAFAPARVPVVVNVHATAQPDDADWRQLLAAQLTRPVRWRESVAALTGLGVTTLVELGPGGVLTGLAKRIAPDVERVSLAAPSDLDALAGSRA